MVSRGYHQYRAAQNWLLGNQPVVSIMGRKEVCQDWRRHGSQCLKKPASQIRQPHENRRRMPKVGGWSTNQSVYNNASSAVNHPILTNRQPSQTLSTFSSDRTSNGDAVSADTVVCGARAPEPACAAASNRIFNASFPLATCFCNTVVEIHPLSSRPAGGKAEAEVEGDGCPLPLAVVAVIVVAL